MGFADLLGKLAGYLDASKLLTLSVPGTLFVIGVLLLIDFPLPSFFEQRRQTRVVVDTSTADHQARDSILLEARDSLWRDLRDSSLRVQRDRFESVMARRDTIERGHRAPVLLTFRARDSLERIIRHETFKRVIRALDSLAVHQRRDSVQRGSEEAVRVALAKDYVEKVSSNSILSRDVQMQINVSDRRGLMLADSLARRGMDIAKWRRDSVRLAPDLAVIDSSWAAFQGSGGFAERLGSLTTDFLIILFMGIVLGTILDPINKGLFASRDRARPMLGELRRPLQVFVQQQHGGPPPYFGPPLLDWRIPDAPLFEFVGRGLVRTEQQDYLVTYYYRFAELTHSLILPIAVLIFGFAHALHHIAPWPVRYLAAITLSVLAWRLLLLLSRSRHGSYRIRQWELCWGAEEALTRTQAADAAQMAGLRADVDRLAPEVQRLQYLAHYWRR